MQAVTEWGPWTDWNPDTAMGPPPDCPLGSTVQADLIVRADWISKTPQPAMITGHEFMVVTGESFALNPPWLHPEDIKASHLVVRYRVMIETILIPDESEIKEPVE